MRRVTSAYRPLVVAAKAIARRGLKTSAAGTSSDLLAHEYAGSADATGGTAVILHGILGSGQNLRTLGRKIAQSVDAQCLLVDLRAHGDSPALSAPHTLSACAADVRRLLQHLDVEPSVVVGHSFGGKVALELLRQSRDTPLSSCWVLDSHPGTLDMSDVAGDEDPNSVVHVIHALRGLERRFDSKEELMGRLAEVGLSPAIQTWMTTNVKRDSSAGSEQVSYVWKFDIEVIVELMQSYGSTDVWPWLANPGVDTEINLVRATRNRLWDHEENVRGAATALAQNPQFRIHDIDAGHWLHAERPNDVVKLMLPSLHEHLAPQ